MKHSDILITAIAPMIWGSSYIVATEFLSGWNALNVAMLRALPTGLLLLLLVRQLPQGWFWLKIFVLGALNFTLFWWLLFEAAYRLPGGVAAIMGAFQPLFVIFIAYFILQNPIQKLSIFAAALGVLGVALLILTPNAGYDALGLLAGIGGAISMAFGTVLSRKWRPDNLPLLTFTAWQLVAGGILLLPITLWLEGLPPMPTMSNVMAISYLGLIGAGLTYLIWFRGIAKIGPNIASMLGFLSPITAVILGWMFLAQNLDLMQLLGIAIILFSIWLSQKA